MLLVGLTGGIGAGKSTLARMLEERGAVVFDADELVRRAVSPGTAGHAAVIARFGREVVAPSGAIDRGKLAEIVFTDRDARRELESIVHPEVFRLLAEELKPHRETEGIVVFDAPLIVEAGFRSACDLLIVVTAPVSVRIDRLVAARGMTEGQVRARIDAQAPDDERERGADLVVHNDGTIADLELKADDLWERLRGWRAPSTSGA